MRTVGIREFRDRATKLLASDEVLAVERHGRLVGYFVPVPGDDRRAAIDAANRLREEAERPDPLADLRRCREQILQACRDRGAFDVRVFGSVVRGEASASSDVDLLVSFEPGRSLFDHGGLVRDLEELLDRSVDVVSERSLKPDVRARVLSDAEPL